MNVISYLLKNDSTVSRLTKKYLLNESVEFSTEGYIQRYLSLFDESKSIWGGGIYSPKWTSTHYTLLELVDMEVDPSHPYLHQGMNTLYKYMWAKEGKINKYRHQDLCVVAMMVYMASYIKSTDPRIYEMVDYILLHQAPDGGWNCMWETKHSKKSSLHTTLSVLEAFAMYEKNGYDYQISEVHLKRKEGESFIFSKKFFRKTTTDEIIHPDMATHHYPPRWKYDYFRAMWYFAKENIPYHESMFESLDMIEKSMQKGYLTTGKKYTGKTHFVLEKGKSGFNTLRALYILKIYRQDVYQLIINKEYL